MSDDFRAEELYGFLDYLANKGLMNSSTAASRKAACVRVLSVANADEREDVRSIDINDIMTRFQRLEGSKYTPESLNVYKSRLKNSIEDLKRFRENPLGFKAVSSSTPPKRQEEKPTETIEQKAEPRQATKQSSRPEETIIPIPLRPDLTVFVQGLPFDLTSKEAAKLANVIRALANEE